jgi:predicted dehydrogenase
MSDIFSRRCFLRGAGGLGAMFCLMPSAVLGANEKINLACVGIGGQGFRDICNLHSTGLVNIVALCDVDMGSSHTARSEESFAGAAKFKDFRKMFDKMSDEIDAVCVATPDHSHFPVCMRAMAEGKNVFVEKPLAHTFEEIELLMAAEKKYGAVCQMGNQGHSGGNYFQFKAWVEAGIIKDVTHVDAYMNRDRRWHPWGDLDSFEKEATPATLDWDLWLATAKHRPYSSKLAPGNWRAWYEFGNGAFGDWGPHTLDTIHQFLKLGLPERIEAVKLVGHKKHIFPMESTIKFDFPARGAGMPAMDITWYDGVANVPPRPKELEERRRIEACGKIIYSKELVFKGGTHSSILRVIPESKMQEMKSLVPKVSGKFSDHYMNFVLGCKGLEKVRSPFSVGGELCEVLALGVIAQRVGGVLEFDRKAKRITNNAVADGLLKGPGPRKGWEEYYKLA